MLHESQNQNRLIARVVWQLLKEQAYTSIADLTADVKQRCAKLRIRCSADDLNEAFTLVGSNTPLVSSRLPQDMPAADQHPMSRADASRLLDGLSGAIHTIPTGDRYRGLSAKEQAALRVTVDAIQAAQTRCAALERVVREEQP